MKEINRNMNDFYTQCRGLFLNETSAQECRNNCFDAVRECRKWLATRLDEYGIHYDARRMWTWSNTSDSLKLINLDYFENLPIEERWRQSFRK
jgi:hypothetical protein